MRASVSLRLVAATIAAVLFADAAVGAAVTTAAATADGDVVVDACVTKYSVWMATSIASRRQGIMTGKGGSSELLQAGVTQRALAAVAAQYPDDAWAGEARAYVRASVESVVPFTLNATHNALSYPMDRLSTGNAMLALYAPGDAATEPFRAAAAALRRSIDLNRRNPEGGLWYFVYPQWSYLDGMYSLAPFYTLYATAAPSANSSDACAADAALDDMYYQIDLLWNRTRDAASGLLVHGYDASGTAVWARAGTGASPHVWGRSLGWYAMALVDTLEVLPPAGAAHGGGAAARHRGPLLAKFQALAAAVAAAADPRTGAWWQVLDAPGRAGNYIESSASAMFAYALLKGARLGYLDVPPPPPPPAYGDSGRPPLARAAATALALRAYRYINQAFLVREPNGTLSYDRTVAVCSLNSTASYEYYVNQPINYNSVLGSAPYVLASLEVERLLGAS